MKYDNSSDREKEKKKKESENLRDRGYIWWLSLATVNIKYFFLQRRINRRDNEQADPFWNYCLFKKNNVLITINDSSRVKIPFRSISATSFSPSFFTVWPKCLQIWKTCKSIRDTVKNLIHLNVNIIIPGLHKFEI